MRVALPGGYELDDDRDRVDVDAVHAFLVEAYWSAGRPLATVERLIREATRVVAVYERFGFRALDDGRTMVRPTPSR